MARWRYALVLIVIFGAGIWIYSIYKSEKLPASIELQIPRSIEQTEVFSVPLRISTSVPMNAAEFYFSFPADLVEVVEIDRTGSFYSLWIKDQPRFDNAAGTLSLAGGLPKPGFVGDDGLVATVKFRARQGGVGQITLDQTKSRILANDGLGTKIEATFNPVSITIR